MTMTTQTAPEAELARVTVSPVGLRGGPEPVHPLTLQDILDEGVRRCEDGEMIIDVAKDIAGRRLLPDVTRLLVVTGIMRKIDDVLESRRWELGRPDDVTTESEAAPVRPPAALNPHAAKMLRIYASATDGVRRAYLHFTISDWCALQGRATTSVATWTALGTAAKIAITALEQTGKATAAELPKKVQQQIAEALP